MKTCLASIFSEGFIFWECWAHSVAREIGVRYAEELVTEASGSFHECFSTWWGMEVWEALRDWSCRRGIDSATWAEDPKSVLFFLKNALQIEYFFKGGWANRRPKEGIEKGVQAGNRHLVRVYYVTFFVCHCVECVTFNSIFIGLWVEGRGKEVCTWERPTAPHNPNVSTGHWSHHRASALFTSSSYPV